MNKAEAALKYFESYNCAQAVLAAHADDCGIDLDEALQAAVGFGGGMGRLQETCGAVTGAILALGFNSGFKEGDSRENINAVYAQVRQFAGEFTSKNGTIKCRDLLGCDLSSEEGHKFFVDNNLRENCRCYVSLACELLEKYLAK